MPERPTAWVAAWRERTAAAGASDVDWAPVVRAGPDPARMYDVLAAQLVAKGGAADVLGPRPEPMPAPPRPRRRIRVPAPWVAGALVAVATAVLFAAPALLGTASPGSDAVYFVLVDRYADGAPDAPGATDRADPQGWHGGDLQGVIDHLDDLDQLGVGAVWLSPVSRARTEKHGPWGAYHGYWVLQLDDVDPRFGSIDDLRALSDGLHARGMKLYLDVVLNHVAPDAPLVQAHPDWFHGLGDVTDWDDPVQLVTHDVHGLPDLRQEDPAVYAYLRDALVRTIDAANPDGFRVDAVRHLPEGFLAELGAELRAKRPGFELLGEVFDGNADHVAARATADHLDGVFDFPLYFALRDTVCDGAPAGRLAAALLADYGPARPFTLVDNHDLPRIASRCGDRAETALALAVTARGTPTVAYGTEAGLTGDQEPDNRGDMDFDADDPLDLRRILAVRAGSAALRDGTERVVGLSEDEVVLARVTAGEVAVVAWRRGGGSARSWTRAGPAQATDTVGEVRLTRHPGVVLADRGPVELVLEVDAPEGTHVVGAGSALGRWDPTAAVPVVDGRARIEVADGSVLAFKLVRAVSDGSLVWEPGPDRFLLVTSDRWTDAAGGEDGCGDACAAVTDGGGTAKIAWGIP